MCASSWPAACPPCAGQGLPAHRVLPERARRRGGGAGGRRLGRPAALHVRGPAGAHAVAQQGGERGGVWEGGLAAVGMACMAAGMGAALASLALCCSKVAHHLYNITGSATCGLHLPALCCSAGAPCTRRARGPPTPPIPPHPPTTMPTLQDFREPLYLTDKPVVLQDTRTEEERRYPELFRWGRAPATLHGGAGAAWPPWLFWEGCMMHRTLPRVRCLWMRWEQAAASRCASAIGTLNTQRGCRSLHPPQGQAGERGLECAKDGQHGAHPRGQHAKECRLPHIRPAAGMT